MEEQEVFFFEVEVFLFLLSSMATLLLTTPPSNFCFSPLEQQREKMSDDPDACPKPRLEEACKALCSKYVVAYQVRARKRERLFFLRGPFVD